MIPKNDMRNQYSDAKPMDPGGLMWFDRCPDCHHKLADLKRTDQSEGAKILAKACINHNCWRYTQLPIIETWKRV